MITTFRQAFFWLMCGGACVLTAGPAGSAVRRTISAVQAETMWKAALASDRPRPEPGEPALWLSIPSIDLDLPALQSVTEDNLHKLPCVVTWPEKTEPGLTVILGHRDMHFRPLEKLRKNATVRITRRTGVGRNYRITAIDILEPDAAQKKIRAHMDSDEIVLMSCYPFRFIGPAPQRILFWASRR